MDLRDLYTLEDFSAVVDLQRRVWGAGYDDVVPISILAVVVKRGGILIGAFDGARLVAFVFAVPGLKHGQPMQWSHMLGVDDAYRRSGIGFRLKLAQRDRALAQGLTLVEWTYDPLMAPNAHLNFARLGVVAEEYFENVYGTSGSLLHAGAPTDRFVASWNIATPHVERRIARDSAAVEAAAARAASEAAATSPPSPLAPAALDSIVLRDATLANAPIVNPTIERGQWLVSSGDPDLTRDDRRLLVSIPARYGDMLQHEPAAALTWRLHTRAIFTTYFARGYRCVDFLLDRTHGRGTYVLERQSS